MIDPNVTALAAAYMDATEPPFLRILAACLPDLCPASQERARRVILASLAHRLSILTRALAQHIGA